MKNIALFVFAIFATNLFAQQKNEKDIRTLIVFFDGLRPDYITAEAMPKRRVKTITWRLRSSTKAGRIRY